MFYVKDPCTLDRPWILSKKGDNNPVVIPLEVTKALKNYHVMAVEFLYHNYRKGVRGSVLNQEPGMNFPLQVAAFLRAVASKGAILVICPQKWSCFWHYHLHEDGGFQVFLINGKNCKDKYEQLDGKVALIVHISDLKLCENFENVNFFSIIIENFDQLANKLIVKRLSGKFNVGLSCRSFYENPDQKLQWKMLNWVNPGCVGKLNDFYEIDNKNLENFVDNYRFWWFRLTWNFCESFKKPTDEEENLYKERVAEWASDNSLDFANEDLRKEKGRKKRKIVESSSESSSDTIINDVPIDKYVKLPSMDESPILTSIIKNFEISSEPARPSTSHCSRFSDDIILSFLDNTEKPSTSRSESEEFILSLISNPERT